MPGHRPELSADALCRLRKLVDAMQAKNGKGVPVSSLVALRREFDIESGLTIDFDATAEIGSPMIVLRVPTPPAGPAGIENLTKRENEIAGLVADGLSNAEIADCLCISVPTVKDHVHNILDKTGLASRTQIAVAIIGRPRTQAL